MRRAKRCQNVCVPISQVNLIFDSRTVWRDLTIWLRSYVNMKHGGLGDEEAIKEKINKVLRQSIHIFSTVFGEEYADEYVNLINEIVRYLGLLIQAQIIRNANMEKESKEKLQEIPEETGTLLARVNPYWEKEQWIELFSLYNQRIIEQSTALLNRDDKEDIYVFDRLLSLSSRIGDYYSRGILDYLMYTGRSIDGK
ncbi:hypothetical protein [Aminipila luticellarii]|uniref:Uncharacterized protein n=1 Tax=Aminipila luticellarii TaxID=2507160 RepID=A0A410PVX6_9FIRM|nr:hypothetical protein [Aminipila luticellarii]QAT43089.1 hypothetical protein EQM06_07485 [Aminipila luticellarii]